MTEDERPEPGPGGDGNPAGHRVPVSIERSIAGGAMAVIFLISITNTVVRYVTSASFAFTEEFSVFLMVVMTFAGASLAFALGENIRMTFLRDRLPFAGRRLFDIVALVASLFMFGLVAWYGGWLSYDEWYWGETSAGLGYPSWIYSIWLSLLSLAIMARILGRLMALARA